MYCIKTSVISGYSLKSLIVIRAHALYPHMSKRTCTRSQSLFVPATCATLTTFTAEYGLSNAYMPDLCKIFHGAGATS